MTFTEDEIQQTIVPILMAFAGLEADTSIRRRNPIPIELPNGRKVDVFAAVPINGGIGIGMRDHESPDDQVDICLRIDTQITSVDIMEMGVKMGLVTGEKMPLGRILKQRESLPVKD